MWSNGCVAIQVVILMLSVREKKLGEQVRIDPPITRGPKSNCSKLSFMTKSNEAEAACE